MTHFEKLSFVVQVTFNTGRELISSCAYPIREFISSSSYSHQKNNLSQLALTKNSLQILRNAIRKFILHST